MIQIRVMKYDFTKVQEAFRESGKTLQQIGAETGVSYVTIHRAMKTHRCHQSTAVALVTRFGLSMKDIQPRRRSIA